MSPTSPDSPAGGEPLSYAAAGVDTDAGDRAVELMRAAVETSHTPQVIGSVGGFAGLFDASALKDYRRPLLASSTDGVGTKVAIAQALDKHDTIGQDLVAMVVDDIVVTGARPLVMTDYIACGRVVPERIAAIVTGIARACAETGTALVGGETAEHPGLLGDDEYDVAGAAVGVVEADQLLGPQRVEAGDALIGMASSGLHANGFSLVRAIVAREHLDLTKEVPELGRTLGEELLEPTRLYTAACLQLTERLGERLHAFSHVTGGGLAANLTRVVPTQLRAQVDRGSWRPHPVFGYLAQCGGLSRDEAERTWNQGVGMIAVVRADGADHAIACCEERGIKAGVIGEIAPARAGTAPSSAKGAMGGSVELLGTHEGRASRA